MNKILNWFFGSCFRTLGRFLAIFIVFFLLLFVGSKIGFELPDWLTLRVNAAEVFYNTNWSSTLPQLDRVDFKSCSGSKTCNTLLESEQDYISINYNNTFRTFNTNTTDMDIGSNGYIIETYANTRAGYLYEVNYYICSNKNIRSSMDVNIYATFWGDGYNLGNTFNATYKTDLGVIPGDQEDGRSFNYCSLFGGFIVPEQNYAWTAIRFQRSSVLSDVYMSVISVEVNELGIYTDTIADLLNDSIENGSIASSEQVNEVKDQVTQVQDEIQNTNDTINNDDTSGAQDSAGGFFDGFQSEDFGLSSIVTAPLRGINAMLNDTCVAPSATYKGQTFSLPCGSMLWSRPGGQDFKNFINVMYGGFLAYLVIRKFFLDVENLKNPNNDRVEVDKL